MKKKMRTPRMIHSPFFIRRIGGRWIFDSVFLKKTHSSRSPHRPGESSAKMRTRFGARKTYGRLIIKEMESHEDGGGNVGARAGGGAATSAFRAVRVSDMELLSLCCSETNKTGWTLWLTATKVFHLHSSTDDVWWRNQIKCLHFVKQRLYQAWAN